MERPRTKHGVGSNSMQWTNDGDFAKIGEPLHFWHLQIHTDLFEMHNYYREYAPVEYFTASARAHSLHLKQKTN